LGIRGYLAIIVIRNIAVFRDIRDIQFFRDIRHNRDNRNAGATGYILGIGILGS
jgi:hypothetical protein